MTSGIDGAGAVWPIVTLPLEMEDDVAHVRHCARVVAQQVGLGGQDQTRVATALSEIARNALGYAGGGKVEFLLRGGARPGLIVRVRDRGGGIANLPPILEGRYRSTTGMGLGINGARRLMDGFEVETSPAGTTVTMDKAVPSGASLCASVVPALADAVRALRSADHGAAIRDENRDLVDSLAALAEREEETRRLNDELESTNRGVVALHAELELRAEELRRAGETLERQVAERTRELAEANARLIAEAAARERVEDDLRQAQKMEAVGQLTGGVAHDFNNLLTVIRSATDLLKRPTLAEDKRVRYIDAISDTVDRAAKLTGQLLAFARRQTLSPEVFSARDGVRSLGDMMRTLTGSRVRIEVVMPTAACFVNADVSQFETALINLAVNARDAMNGEGRLTIEVAVIEPVPAIRTHPPATGAYVAISLSDTGSGIPTDTIDRIFEPFFTTKEVGRGTGLGLSQVFGFAKQSGGDISVASTVGEGTTFTLFLPRVAAPSQAKAADEAAAPVDGHGFRVLVVEDNVEVGTFALHTLSDLGYAPVLTPNGAAALAELAKDPDRFDVVFSDVMMPGMTGIELGQEIRRLYHDLPVVLTSGYSHILAQNGTHGFELLHKPYSVEQLSQVFAKATSQQSRSKPFDR